MLALTHKSLNRRKILMMGAMAPIFAPAILRAASAEFTYKFATGQDPAHPVNIRLNEAFDRIRDKTSGKLEIKLFPANQLGTETNVISQIRNGGLEFTILSASILATLVPVSGIANTAYAFRNYDDVWKAMDGTLGKYIQAQITKAGLIPNAKIWDNGFRQCTSSTRDLRGPEDFVGFKIRVPPAPMLTSFFSAIGALAYTNELRRGLYGTSNQDYRGAGERPFVDRDNSPLRGTKILCADRSQLGRLLAARQQQRVAAAPR
jgi:TRAP-type C4-dicarboxylate transport system substrate-binding protein